MIFQIRNNSFILQINSDLAVPVTSETDLNSYEYSFHSNSKTELSISKYQFLD